jgi:ATP-dependent Clp protease ATP-binding subunit ClpC
VRRPAQGRGVDLVIGALRLKQLATAGFQPKFGARELHRLIRSELETQLARAILPSEVHEGDRVLTRSAQAAEGRAQGAGEPRPRCSVLSQ